MPRKKLELEEKENGRYSTAGLDSKQFMQAFEIIRKQNNKKRRKAPKTITREMLKRKSPADLKRLGNKQDGEPFTREDLIALEKSKKNSERRYDKNTAGITYAQLVAGSREIDIKRANNQVNDGSGITGANLVAIKANVAVFRVKASKRNGDDDHMVSIRFETWSDYMSDADPTVKGYQKATSKATKDRISIACDCGRHQYYYRYLATISNYCIAPPLEFSPPKIRNPKNIGVACKHVLHATNKLQSPTWGNQLAIYMQKQAKKVGYGDDRKSNHVFDEQDLKQQKKTRKGKTNQKALQAEYKKYVDRQQALADKMASKEDKKKIDAARAGLDKSKRKVARQQTQIDNQKAVIAKKDAQLAKERSASRDWVRMSYQMFKDLNVSKKWTSDQSINAFAKTSGKPVKTLKGILEND